MEHIITLKGDAARGKRISVHVLSVLCEVLVDTAQRALRLQADGRSHLQSKPEWLQAATDMDFSGTEIGSTEIVWDAPLLGQAAPEIYQQYAFWDKRPTQNETAFSLMELAVSDAISGNAESDRLDRNILNSVSGWGRLLDFGFSSVSLNGIKEKEPVRITKEGLVTAEKLHTTAPSGQRTIISGTLDQLTGSKRAFRLLLSNGQHVRGVLPHGPADSYRNLWNERVVVDGEAVFKPSGALSVITATHIQPATTGDQIWERVPRARPQEIELLTPRSATMHGGNNLARVFGKWPGDETEEEIWEMLKEVG